MEFDNLHSIGGRKLRQSLSGERKLSQRESEVRSRVSVQGLCSVDSDADDEDSSRKQKEWWMGRHYVGRSKCDTWCRSWFASLVGRRVDRAVRQRDRKYFENVQKGDGGKEVGEGGSQATEDGRNRSWIT